MSKSGLDTSKTVWAVILEWNGQDVPGTFYNHLYKMAGLRAATLKRDKKDDISQSNPLTRRESENGVIVQEGCIITPSESMARLIASLATEGLDINRRNGTKERVRPAFVLISEMEIRDFEATAQDMQTLKRVQSVISKRGRKKADDIGAHAVTCLEDIAGYEVESHAVVNCPYCGGTRIRVRKGNRRTFKDPGGFILTAWVRTRFADGMWEIPEIGGDLEPPLKPVCKNADEEAFTKSLLRENEQGKKMPVPFILALEANQSLTRAEKFRILDGLLISRVHWTEDRRKEARLKALMEYFILGGSTDDVSLAEQEDPDWFDLGGPFGENETARLAFAQLRGNDGASNYTKI